MMLKRSTTESKPSAKARLVRAGLATVAVVTAVGALATGCLDRPVVKAQPKTSNVFVDQIVQTSVDKIDLLFMVDNSASMADKQEILQDAVPVLVSRLVSPICIRADGTPTGKSGDCGNDGAPEFSPIGDIHIGVVDSSLGAHGGSISGCGDVQQENDNGRLLGSVRDGVASWNNSGFLAWDASGKANNPPGESSPGNLNMAFQNMVAATREKGCGFEAQLEAWYRFLVDPEPPASVKNINGQTVRSSKLTVNPDGTTGACVGCDDTLLAQRKAFLRPDSLVAIVMLSDENDCSIRDDGVGWFVAATSRMPRATAPCDADPNAACCRSCAQIEASPPSGCGALADDTNCKNVPAGQKFAAWEPGGDALNLRCYDQKRRFGFDLLYETGRYVNALKNKTIQLQSTGQSVPNPLYDAAGSDKAPRDPSLVFLAGIVGVPWQDIADDASLTGAGLKYLSAKELLAKDRWSALIGSPGASPPVPPTDPFMIETYKVRTGTNSIAMPPVQIVGADSKDPHANIINGHEQNVPDQADLQYACTFPLKTPKMCAKGDKACDCTPDGNGGNGAVVAANSPLCQGGATINQQTSAKAYPGTRELQVLKDLGDNAIVASICPKVIKANGTPQTDPNYGYNPAVGAIIERLKEALKGKCLPRPIGTDPDPMSPTFGQVLCKVIEAQKAGCDCTLPGRGVPSSDVNDAVQAQLKASGNCDGAGQTKCKSWCTCEILQEKDAALAACINNQTPATPGYCYVDKEPTLLAKCPANQQQLLRFVGDPNHQTPAQGSVAFIACLGEATDPSQK